tara:strand:+ start:82 stop:237 length:156 start_codon:yes stop_codon:yes gene_type:complete
LKSFSVNDYPSAFNALIAASTVISAGIVDVLAEPTELPFIKKTNPIFDDVY